MRASSARSPLSHPDFSLKVPPMTDQLREQLHRCAAARQKKSTPVQLQLHTLYTPVQWRWPGR
ncbi:hypothetical protein UB43_22560 [Pseudomonas sp. 21]|nr:hypothetical protein UB43_22560 [Pseudomonas sp. 21]